MYLSPILSPQTASLTASQLLQGVFRSVDSSPPAFEASYWSLPAVVQQATARLVNIVQVLCTPDSGWPKDKPQTLETLSTYVCDEAEELLEALRQWQLDRQTASAPLMALPSPPSQTALGQIAELGAYLIWSIAASTPEAMALLEGVPATWQSSAQKKQRQGIRLVPVLTIRLDNVDYDLDLITQAVFEPSSTLSDNSLLQLGGDHPIPSPLFPVSDWRKALWAGVIATTPKFSQWQQGQALQILMPSQTWCLAQVSLRLQLVTLAPQTATSAIPEEGLIPPALPAHSTPIDTTDPQVCLGSLKASPPSLSAVAPKCLPASSQNLPLATEISFLDKSWRQSAIAAMLSTDLGTSWGIQPTDKTLDTLTIVRETYQTLNSQSTILDTKLHLFRSPLTLADLCAQVQWLWVRTHPELMSLMSGVAAKQLRPGNEWQTGILVATGQLLFQSSSEISWLLEISTRQWHPDIPQQSAADILYLHPTSLLADNAIWQMADLRAHLDYTLYQRSPILAHLINGTTVELVPPQSQPSSAFIKLKAQMQLQVALQFHPLE